MPTAEGSFDFISRRHSLLPGPAGVTNSKTFAQTHVLRGQRVASSQQVFSVARFTFFWGSSGVQYGCYPVRGLVSRRSSVAAAGRLDDTFVRDPGG
jgi:hypothetical protein